MRFVPLTPARLAADLAAWINGLDIARPRIGIDGPAEIGAADLADAVAAELPALGRPAVRVSTSWWWRPASLRLEFGKNDVDMLLGGWVDDARAPPGVARPASARAVPVATFAGCGIR